MRSKVIEAFGYISVSDFETAAKLQVGADLQMVSAAFKLFGLQLDVENLLVGKLRSGQDLQRATCTALW